MGSGAGVFPVVETCPPVGLLLKEAFELEETTHTPDQLDYLNIPTIDNLTLADEEAVQTNEAAKLRGQTTARRSAQNSLKEAESPPAPSTGTRAASARPARLATLSELEGQLKEARAGLRPNHPDRLSVTLRLAIAYRATNRLADVASGTSA